MNDSVKDFFDHIYGVIDLPPELQAYTTPGFINSQLTSSKSKRKQTYYHFIKSIVRVYIDVFDVEIPDIEKFIMKIMFADYTQYLLKKMQKTEIQFETLYEARTCPFWSKNRKSLRHLMARKERYSDSEIFGRAHLS